MDWKEAIERRGMEVNFGKIKLMVPDKKNEIIRSGIYPCGVYEYSHDNDNDLILCVGC